MYKRFAVLRLLFREHGKGEALAFGVAEDGIAVDGPFVGGIGDFAVENIGADYTLETKSSLTNVSWTSNSAVVGTGGDVTVTTAVDQAQSFCRVTGE